MPPAPELVGSIDSLTQNLPNNNVRSTKLETIPGRGQIQTAVLATENRRSKQFNGYHPMQDSLQVAQKNQWLLLAPSDGVSIRMGSSRISEFSGVLAKIASQLAVDQFKQVFAFPPLLNNLKADVIEMCTRINSKLADRSQTGLKDQVSVNQTYIDTKEGRIVTAVAGDTPTLIVDLDGKDGPEIHTAYTWNYVPIDKAAARANQKITTNTMLAGDILASRKPQTLSEKLGALLGQKKSGSMADLFAQVEQPLNTITSSLPLNPDDFSESDMPIRAFNLPQNCLVVTGSDQLMHTLMSDIKVTLDPNTQKGYRLNLRSNSSFAKAARSSRPAEAFVTEVARKNNGDDDLVVAATYLKLANARGFREVNLPHHPKITSVAPTRETPPPTSPVERKTPLSETIQFLKAKTAIISQIFSKYPRDSSLELFSSRLTTMLRDVVQTQMPRDYSSYYDIQFRGGQPSVDLEPLSTLMHQLDVFFLTPKGTRVNAQVEHLHHYDARQASFYPLVAENAKEFPQGSYLETTADNPKTIKALVLNTGIPNVRFKLTWATNNIVVPGILIQRP